MKRPRDEISEPFELSADPQKINVSPLGKPIVRNQFGNQMHRLEYVYTDSLGVELGKKEGCRPDDP